MARSALHQHSDNHVHVSAAGETAAQQLAAYACALRFDDLPASPVERAKHCLIDAVGCAIFGQRFPWSAMVLAEALASGEGGPCRLPGVPDKRLHVPQAALALGAFAHAFELDSLSKPGMGVHPGATVALPALAMAQAVGASGRDLIAAIVAGVEVMFRIGMAMKHSSEHIGFHAPGMTGPFGSAAACARLMRLSPRETANAFGIAGSLAGGLMAFAKAPSGGMIKRLHLGRAAEAGVTAARLAQRGYEGPPSVLEGRFGLLEAFCEDSDASLLTKNLGRVYEFERLCIKSYGLHVTAQVPVQLLRGWIAQHGFAGDDIAEIAFAGSAKVVSHHGNADPADIMLAQYSVPFATALSAYYDPLDPGVFTERTIADARVRELAKRVRVTSDPKFKMWGGRMVVTLRDGRVFEEARESFLGCPETPMSPAQLRGKFDKFTPDCSSKLKATLFDDLMRIEQLPSLEALALS
jgi:2-methylcitrate dehydratase PrpD